MSQQAQGALPNGTRVRKVWTLPGDAHQNGTRAVVLSSTGPHIYADGTTYYMYRVLWDGEPEPCLIAGLKLRPIKSP